MVLLVLTGRRRVGKDTLANFLVDRYGFTKLSFAEPLKEVVETLYDIRVNDDNKDTDMEKFKKTYRELLIETADKLKEINETIFLEKFKNKNQRIIDNYNIVISDLRFQYEYDYVKSLNATIIKITNPNTGLVNIEEEDLIDKFNYEYSITNVEGIENYLIKAKTLFSTEMNLKELKNIKVTNNKYVFFPFKKGEEKFGNYFIDQHQLHWTFGELDFSKDRNDYNKLPQPLREIFDTILAYFAFTDGIIAENCVDNFSRFATTSEQKAAYAAQTYFEYIHGMTYSFAIETYIQDEEKRQFIFDSYLTSDFVREKTVWTEKYMDLNIPEAERLVSYACTEGIFFISAFAFIFYLKSKSLFPEFASANEMISRDEAIHCNISIDRYKHLYGSSGPKSLPENLVHEIISSAVKLECDFVDKILPERFEDLDPKEIKSYVQNLGDRIAQKLGYKSIYNTKSHTSVPEWLSTISLEPKHNFYESNAINYSQGSKKQMDIKQVLEDNDKDIEDIDY